MKKKLGERLLEAGLVDDRQLAEALQAQQSTGEQLGRLLVRLGHLQEDDLLRLLCEDAGIPFETLDELAPTAEAVGAIPEEVARTVQVLPLRVAGDRLVVALANPFDVGTLTSLERMTGMRVSPVGAPRGRIIGALDLVYGNGENGTRAEPGAIEASAGLPWRVGAEEVQEPGQNASAAAETIFREAVSLGATDIHVEPSGDSVRVRYRLDGILRSGPTFPRSLQSPLLTRIKVLGGLNIAENRLPQDGRLRVEMDGREIDMRISTFPTVQGEDLVMRVLDRQRVALDLARVGLDGEGLLTFRDVLSQPLGLMLITGPTGSGKTTTLYSALAELNTGERCIITLEDPVEYEIEGIRQSQINLRAGLTFASGLRSMLRHDPDVILVGEIRDLETAEIALAAAMTGHMVLSTLHTNSAAAAIPRLLDMGVEPFALASSLRLCAAQRLLRILCEKCREETDVPAAVRRRFGLEATKLYRPRGCPACHQTGYRGRIAIFEILPVNDDVANAIHERRRPEEIERLAGHSTLLDAGLARVRAGVTTLEELVRVVSI
jgi:type IV pilus assembly protein PilB